MTSNTEPRLTYAEKLIIWLLADILKHTKDYRESNKMALLQEVILGGHLWALKEHELFGENFTEHIDSQSSVKLVYDALDMWSFIERAYKRFNAEEKKQIEKAIGSGGKPKFTGFDEQNEIEHLSIARFLVEKLGKFQAFKGRDFNSHAPLDYGINSQD